MELYSAVCQSLAQNLTRRYSSSFSMASRLFRPEVQSDIYNVYGLVRIADEIVDTYRGPDAGGLLDDLEQETYAALSRGFSANPIIQAFQATAMHQGIGKSLIGPFFASMRMDLTPRQYDVSQYGQYIHGSAEVIGLMCLRIFCAGDEKRYADLAPGAQRLGAAYQKINFLRDFAEDVHSLGRSYFPQVQDGHLTDEVKAAIVKDIRQDLAAAGPSIRQLPPDAAAAVGLSRRYYSLLLDKLDAAPATVVSNRRLRLSVAQKLALFVRYRLFG